MESIKLKEKYRFQLKFKTYNPEDFKRIEELLQRLFAKDSQETVKNTSLQTLHLSETIPKVAGNLSKILEESPSLIQRYLKGMDFKLKGPIPLPRTKKLFTVNRSHHVHKKSQEQFLLTTYKRVWVLEMVKDVNTYFSPEMPSQNLVTNGPEGMSKFKKLTFPQTIPVTLLNVEGQVPVLRTARKVEEKRNTQNNVKLDRHYIIPWCLEDDSLLNIIKGVRLALEPLEEIPGLTIHWQGSRIFGTLLFLLFHHLPTVFHMKYAILRETAVPSRR